MSQTYFLPAKKLKLRLREDGALAMNLDGQSVNLAQPKRTLPLSDPFKFIALYDEESNELGIVRDIEELEPESRELLQQALSKAYVIEHITRIPEVERDTLTGQTRWRVEIATHGTADKQDPEPSETQLDGASPKLLDGHGELPKIENPAAKSASNGDAINSVSHPSLASAGNNQDNNGTEPGDNSDAHSDDKFLDKVRWFRHLSKDKDTDGASITTAEREFLINGQEDVQTARYPHIYIVDTERKRYEILDCEALDLESRRAAERFF